MVGFKKIKFKRIEIFFKKLPRALAENAFLAFLGLVILSLILGAIYFYYCRNSAGVAVEIGKEEKPFGLDEKAQQRVLEEWQRQNQRFLETDLKKYPDPFRVD